MSTVLIRRLLSRLTRKDCLISLSLTTKFDQHYLYKQYSQPRLLLNMNEAFVKYNEGTDVFDISFRYNDPEINLDRQFNFSRQVNEPVNNFLQRIDANIGRMVMKKNKRKRKKNELPTEMPVTDNVKNKKIKLLQNDSIVDGNTPCKYILDDPSDLKLIIFDAEYLVKRNVPNINTLALPSSILIGFPTYPSKFESTHTDKTKSVFKWYKLGLPGSNTWAELQEGYLYTPSVSDLSCKLKLMCIPKNDTQTGPAIEVESKGFVEAGPGPCPFDARHAFTSSKLSGKSFRVVSYNILAEVYAETDYSKDVLYPYCAPYALTMDYRKLLILKELIGFNADIICLQEVDSKVYHDDLLPSLSMLNYDSVHNPKNNLREGLAIFFNKERFDMSSSVHSVLSQGTDLNEFQNVWAQIHNEKAKETFLNRNTVIQAVTLQSKENTSEIVIVGNVHLYFRPIADHIRLLQAFYAITYLNKLAKEVKEQNPKSNVSILLCGDFNSTPECGIYQLMTENYVPEDRADWKSNPEETIENVSLKQPLRLASACGTPEYTNYTPDFSGCLDYIFYQMDHLKVEQVIPMPSKEELVLHQGLPSVVFPSDHISLCADFKWPE